MPTGVREQRRLPPGDLLLQGLELGTMRYIEHLREALEHLLTTDPTVYLLGEDIEEPYGGAFKVTKGLSAKFPGRLLNMPMSEQGYTGVGIGMALAGLKPIVEIMFGDFVTLVADQVINHLAKFYEMYDRPLHFVLRTPSGGYRGYGATHSQSLERLFLGIPGLRVVAPNVLLNPGELLITSIHLGQPVIFVENKLDYARAVTPPGSRVRDLLEVETAADGPFPIQRLSLPGETPEVSFVTYGGVLQEVITAQETLIYEHEVISETLVLSDLSHFPAPTLVRALRGRVAVVVEEGWVNFGWARDVAYRIQHLGGLRSLAIGARDHYIPASEPLENFVLPKADRIVAETLALVEGGAA